MQAADEYLAQFDPFRDPDRRVDESPHQYAVRLQSSLLPHWPSEVLIEWLYRHAGHIYAYAFLRFELFQFSKVVWPLEKIPGREAFADPRFCDDFQNVEERARNRYDWLAKYMIVNGTWNTPVILLETPQVEIVAPGGWVLRYPLHLLEGHRRLSFLTGLRAISKALPQHAVWLVNLPG
jgi:hypothetical protein